MFKKLLILAGLLVPLGVADAAHLTVHVAPQGVSGSVMALSLTNGPPNIPNATSCSPKTCSWIGAGWPSGTHVSLVYADMRPISTDYTGTFSLADQPGHTGDAAHFSISTATVGYTDSFNSAKSRNVGEIKTSGSVPAGDYFIRVTADGQTGSNTQDVHVHAVGGTNVSCGGAIPTSGTVLLSPNCTYTISSGITPSASTLYLGAGNGGTILSGTSGACRWLDDAPGFPNVPDGWAVIGVQFEGFCAGGRGPAPIVTSDDNTVRNSRFLNVGATAVFVVGNGNFIANNYINNTQYAGIEVSVAQFSSGSTGQTTLIGNEVAFTNQGGFDSCDDVSASKIIPQFVNAPQVNVLNSYYHDNAGNDIWTDTSGGQPYHLAGNTLVRAGLAGTQIEQTSGGATGVDHNVIVHAMDGSSSTGLSPPCGGESFFPDVGGAIWINGSSSTEAWANNISVFTGPNKVGHALNWDDEIGNGTGASGGNDTAHNNTVNFFTRDPQALWGWNPSGEAGSAPSWNGNASDNNHFHLVGGNTASDPHWGWFSQSKGATATFSAYQGVSGQDGNSSLDTNDASTPGCTHVACSGSGVDDDGRPLQ